MKRPGTWGPCDFCQSEAYLYPRLNKLACRGCIELGIVPGRFMQHVARTGSRAARDREVDLRQNPLSQPNYFSNRAKYGNCVYCGVDCVNTFVWQDTVAHACGWGHVGFWMDGEIAALEAADMLTGGNDG